MDIATRHASQTPPDPIGHGGTTEPLASAGRPIARLGRTARTLLVAALVSATAVAYLHGSASAAHDAIEPHGTATAAQHPAEHADGRLAWGPAPPGFPPGAELALVQGDPAVNGAVFTIRLRMPNDYVLPPHFHPEDEHVTVLSGQFEVGLGNVVDTASVVASLQRNGFITAPKLHTHWGVARGRTVVQVHGIGPFQTTFVDAQGTPLSQ